MKTRAALRLLATGALALCGCLGSDPVVTGGSSEVDNPILVAFTDSAGAALSVSGSVSIYLADQNPATDPDPLLKRQVSRLSAVTFAARDFTQDTYTDTARAYNVLLIGEDSTGALLQNLSYDPVTRKYALGAGAVSQAKLSVAPLVRYAGSLDLANDTGLVRVIIPGTPFQSVVVDSGFVLYGVPQGDFTLHVLPGDGSERVLTQEPPASPGGPPQHHVDSGVPPIQRPPRSPSGGELVVHAGPDQSLFFSPTASVTEASLLGVVSGPDPQDARLAVIWRQVLTDPQDPKATIETPTARNTRVFYPRPGAYRFVLSAQFGSLKADDTVLVAMQAPSGVLAFIAPSANDTLFVGASFNLVWDSPMIDTLTLQVSRDSLRGNWETVPGPAFLTRPGLNQKLWTPAGPEAVNAQLRFIDRSNTVKATSARVWLLNRPPPPVDSGKSFAAEAGKPQRKN